MSEIQCYLSLAIILVLWILALGWKVVPEYQRLVVLRLGRPLDNPKGPGIVYLIPMIDRTIKIDLREQFREVIHQVSTTKDNVSISIMFVWYYRILDPVKAILTISNFEAAATGVAISILHSLIRELTIDEILSQDENIKTDLQIKLDKVTSQWGVKVTNIEIREIIPPRGLHQEMKPQIMAEQIQNLLGTLGETQTTVHTTGTILIGNNSWDAMSGKPIPPKSKVRIKRVVLEIEDDTSAKAA